MKKIGIAFSILAAALIVLIVLAAVLFSWPYLENLAVKIFSKLPEVGTGLDDFAKGIGQRVSLPSPLKAKNESPQSFLTVKGVIEFTNSQREKYGLVPLKENSMLSVSAETKNEDMCANQYFEHVSPSGKGIGDLTKEAGYEFITVGENLALGNFKDDETLVQGWMDSPGHRENILNQGYRDIGVSVLRCEFEGRATWLAVQHFGLPVSACAPAPEILKAQIDLNQMQINELSKNLNDLQAEIKNISPGDIASYVQKIKEYNALVSQYNNLVRETGNLVSRYNAEVKQFNDCVNSFE